MSVKQIGLSSLVVALCSLGGLQAQGPAPAAGGQAANQDVLPFYTPSGQDLPYNPAAPTRAPLSSYDAAPAGTTPEGVAIDEGSPPAPPLAPAPLAPPLSPYLNYPHAPCCCGPVGKCGGPIGSELFVRSGWAFPIGNSIFSKYLHTGWDVEGGGRVLFFNQPSTAAWTVQLSVSNIFARTGDANQPITLYRVPVRTTVKAPASGPTGASATVTPVTVTVPDLTVTVSSLNMTFVNAGFGHDWWLHGSANPGEQHSWNWRIGVDGGGRWGSAKVNFNEITHKTDVVGGLYVGGHSYIECPFRCGIAFAGAQLEYNYIWTSLLQDQNNGNFSSINFLLELGVRF